MIECRVSVWAGGWRRGICIFSFFLQEVCPYNEDPICIRAGAMAASATLLQSFWRGLKPGEVRSGLMRRAVRALNPEFRGALMKAHACVATASDAILAAHPNVDGAEAAPAPAAGGAKTSSAPAAGGARTSPAPTASSPSPEESLLPAAASSASAAAPEAKTSPAPKPASKAKSAPAPKATAAKRGAANAAANQALIAPPAPKKAKN